MRFWSDHLPRLFEDFCDGEGESRGNALRRSVGPAIPGVGIIMYVSFVESLALDELRSRKSNLQRVDLKSEDWRQELHLDMGREGWLAINAMTRLRHCFAHEYGRATQQQAPHVVALPSQLSMTPVSVSWKTKNFKIGAFFSVETSAEIVLLKGSPDDIVIVDATRATKLTTLALLEQLETGGGRRSLILGRFQLGKPIAEEEC